MKNIINTSFFKFLNENSKDYDIVYRGQPSDKTDISPNKSVWVSYDYNFASEYGKVNKYKLPKNINLLDTNDYVKWEELIDEFSDYGDYEEYKYEPSDDFIEFLSSKNYDGFINGDIILLFNKELLS